MLNTVILMGRLTANPELRQTNSGATSCRFTVAIDRMGQNNERTADFVSCTAWNKTAEWMSKFTEKGSMVIVEGALRTGSYPDKKYPDITHYTTDVWANRVSFGETKAAHDLAKQNRGAGYGGNEGYGQGGNEGYGQGGNGGYGQGGNGGYGQGGGQGNGGYGQGGNSGNYGGNNCSRNNPPQSQAPFDNFPPQMGGLS
jgi:single-strand DNA-binding protein